VRNSHPSQPPAQKRKCAGCKEPTEHPTKLGDSWLCDSCFTHVKQRAASIQRLRRPPSEEAREAFRNDSRRTR
jgi:hypothetical protein